MTQHYSKPFRLAAFSLALLLAPVPSLAHVPSLAPGDGSNVAAVTGSLTTRDNRPVLLNGNPATTGTTVLDGTTIETPEGVGATVSIVSLGEARLAPNTKVKLEFRDGRIQLHLIKGCAILKTNKGAAGGIYTARGPAAEANPAKADSIDVCVSDEGGSPVVGQGAAATAGAGANAASVVVAAPVATGGGLGIMTVLLAAAGGGFAVLFAIGAGGGGDQHVSPVSP